MRDTHISIKDSLGSGLINGIINSVIAYYLFKSEPAIPISLDIISSNTTTVWGQAVSMTFGLGIILTLITSKLFIRQLKNQYPQCESQLAHSLFPQLLSISLGNATTLFGWFIVLAVLWTKFFGIVMVSPMVASVLVGIFAFVITLAVEIRTKNSIIYRKISILE
ncbi:permease [Parasalinivibrio latis]|uniref:permease n=1 Tax=Parasalinivibrio latis TaxID=2952610 RepID=UPI0030E5DD19